VSTLSSGASGSGGRISWRFRPSTSASTRTRLSRRGASATTSVSTPRSRGSATSRSGAGSPAGRSGAITPRPSSSRALTHSPTEVDYMASSAQALAAQLADLTRRLAALERGSQLSHSTFPGPNEAPVRVVDGLRAGVEAGALAAAAIERATAAEAKAGGAVVSFFGDEEPEGAKEGDLWRKTSGDVLQYVGGEWVAVSDPEIRADLDEALGRLSGAEEALDGKVTTYFRPESDPPSGQAVGDLWIVEGTNELRRWDGFAWIDARDVGIEEALTEAGNAKSAAEQAWRDAGDAKRDATSALESAAGKTRVTFSPDDPSADGTTGGDIWFKRDDRDRIVGQWEWDADLAQWLPVTLSSEVIAGLDVGKLTVGTAEVSTGVVEHLLAKNVQLPGTLRATQDSFDLTLSGRRV